MSEYEAGLCKDIIRELIEIVNDPNEDEVFREEIRNELLEIKNEIEQIILENQ